MIDWLSVSPWNTPLVTPQDAVRWSLNQASVPSSWNSCALAIEAKNMNNYWGILIALRHLHSKLLYKQREKFSSLDLQLSVYRIRNCLCVLLHIARHDYLASVLAGKDCTAQMFFLFVVLFHTFSQPLLNDIILLYRCRLSWFSGHYSRHYANVSR